MRKFIILLLLCCGCAKEYRVTMYNQVGKPIRVFDNCTKFNMYQWGCEFKDVNGRRVYLYGKFISEVQPK